MVREQGIHGIYPCRPRAIRRKLVRRRRKSDNIKLTPRPLRGAQNKKDREMDDRIKDVLKQSPEELVKKFSTFGGSLWEKHGKKRIYFNYKKILSDYGYKFSRYNTGNISSASLEGDKISNGSMAKILDEISDIKFFIDLSERSLRCGDSELAQEIFEYVLITYIESDTAGGV